MSAATLLKAQTPPATAGLAAVPGDQARLTAYLAIVAAARYVGGDDSAARAGKRGKLRPLVYSDDSVQRRAEAYVKGHSFDDFLLQLPPLLDTDGRLCLLLNVCDALLADTALTAGESERFGRLLTALGQSKSRFQPYFDAIAVKNRTSALGNLDAAPKAETLTPAMALVVALLHMLAAASGASHADAALLGTEFGASEAMLGAAAKYTDQVRVPQFLESAVRVLDERQRLCVLLNVCDLMMRDRRGADAGRSLFRRMRSALGFDGKAFDPYLNLVLLKNDLPHETEKRLPGTSVFDRKYQWAEEGAQAGTAAAAPKSEAPPVAVRNSLSAALDQRIARVRDKTRQLSSALVAGATADSAAADPRDQTSTAPASAAHDGPADLRAYRDGEFSGKGAQGRASNGAVQAPGRSGLSQPGDRRALSDRKMSGAGRHIVDDRSAFGSVGNEPSSGPVQGKTIARMDAVVDRTRTLNGHIDAMLSARSVEEANKIPALPQLSAAQQGRPETASSATAPGNVTDGAMATVEASKTAAVAMVIEKSDAQNDAQNDARNYSRSDSRNDSRNDNRSDNRSDNRNDDEKVIAITDEAGTGQPAQEGEQQAFLEDQGRHRLLAVDEGGPFVNLDASPASREDIALNRTLRRLGVILLPALLLIYGTTLVSEMISSQTFIENGNLATDARIVHRMASLQHSLQQIAPEPNAIVATTAAFGAEEAELSDREKASRFLEKRKDEMATLSRRHESASAVAAERQQWFATSKSIVLLGLGMALWGMLFRSKRMLHVSTFTGITSMLLCANGYWLWVRI